MKHTSDSQTLSVSLSSSIDPIQKAKLELQYSVDSIDKLICVIKKDGIIIRANKAIERWGNSPVKSVVGKSIHKVIHPNCKAESCFVGKILELSSKVLDTGVAVDFRSHDHFLNLDVHAQLSPVSLNKTDSKGRALVIIFQDITSVGGKSVGPFLDYDWQIRAGKFQRELFPSKYLNDDKSHFYLDPNFLDYDYQQIEGIKKEWEIALDSLDELLCLVNSEGRIVRANRAIEKWKLGKVTAVKGKKFHDLMHFGCTDPNCYLSNFSALILDVIVSDKSTERQIFDPYLKRHLNYQINRVYSDVALESELVIISISDVKKIQSSSNTIESLKKNLNKKIELKSLALEKLNKKLQIQIEKSNQAKASLKESHQAYLNLLDTMSEGVVVQDAESKIVYVNRKMSKMLGHPKSQLLGQVLDSFFDRNDSSDVGGFGDNILHENGQLNRIHIANGKKLWVKVSTNDLLKTFIDSDGQSLVITDINDFVESQRKLIAADEQLRLLSQRVLDAQEVERKRIAFELHDGLGQTLSAVKFYVENTINNLSLDSKVSGDRLNLVVTKLQDAVDEVRRISMDLRPSMLDDIGVIATLEWFRREMSLLYPEIKFDFSVSNLKESDVGDARKTQIFRITQEGVNNACKYSKGDHIKFSLGRAGRKLILKVSDNGHGFDSENVMLSSQDRKPLGLISMRERTETSGGVFQIESDGEGTVITCRWNFS
jgi:PAS domain S-box-containing protein